MKRRKTYEKLDAIARKASDMHVAELSVNGIQASEATKRAIEIGVVSGILISACVVSGEVERDDEEYLASKAMSAAAQTLANAILGGGDGK